MKLKKKVRKSVLHIVLLALSFLSIYPVLVMVFGSFKTASEFVFNPAGLPQAFTLENYQRLIDYNSGLIIRSFCNSLFVSTVYTAITLVIASMAAFAFAKFRFKGRNLLFTLFLATMVIPAEVNIPPMYLMFSKINWLNTYVVQILPQVANVFALYMLKQYMETIPDEIMESAVVDGAGSWRIYRAIMLPLTKPVMGALAILLFLNKWNDYMWPLIMVNKQQYMPISVILPTLNDTGALQMVPWELVLTGCTVVTIPVLICFLLFQDKFMQSITIGAVKG